MAIPSLAQEVDPLAALERRVVNLVERVEPSVVAVIRGRRDEVSAGAAAINPFGVGPGRESLWNDLTRIDHPDFIPDRFGAGVIVADESGRRYVLTDATVVSDGPVRGRPETSGQSRIFIRFADGRGTFATIHASDFRSGLAVLSIENTTEIPRPLPLANSAEYRKGQLVFLFGNPFAIAADGSASVGWGMVGNVARSPAPTAVNRPASLFTDETIHQYGTLLQLDCRVPLGFGGGPVANRAGELIGLTTNRAALRGYESSTGFAVPIDGGIRRVIASLVAGYEVEYGLLGIQPAVITAEQLRNQFGLLRRDRGGVRVESVKVGSPGDRGGLKAGDIILAIDGRTISGVDDLMKEVGFTAPGTTVALDTLRLRGRESQTVRVTLGKWPVADERDTISTVSRFEPWRGLTVDYATARQKYLSPRLEPYPRGVVVLSAEQPLGGDRPLAAGDFIVAVNETPVESPEEFYNAVRERTNVSLKLADGRTISVP